MRTLVLSPVLRNAAAGPRTAKARLEEAVGLARAIDLEVVHGEVVRLSRLRPSTLLGSGAVERLKTVIEAEEIGLAVVDWALTPVQQRNLEKEWSCKVIVAGILRSRAAPGPPKAAAGACLLSHQRSRPGPPHHLERQRGAASSAAPAKASRDRPAVTAAHRRSRRSRGWKKRTCGLRAGCRRVPLPVVALWLTCREIDLFNALTNSTVVARTSSSPPRLDDPAHEAALGAPSRSPIRWDSSPSCLPIWWPPSALRWRRSWRPISSFISATPPIPIAPPRRWMSKRC
jgi:GTP-binding protein HflX